MTDFAALIGRLSSARLEFILIGGVAATIHGSARITRDVDLVYARRAENIKRICEALIPVHPYLRGAPKSLPFRLDVATMTSGLNFTLTTDEGDLDLLGDMTGGGTYEQLRPHAVLVEVYGQKCYALSVEQLIAAKRAAGRPRDLEAIAELEVIRDRLDGANKPTE